LLSIWGFSSFFAWGLVTASPYAIRALEKVTRRRCDPEKIKENIKQLFDFGVKNVNYIHEGTEARVGEDSSMINTAFYIDHSETATMLHNVVSDDKPWLLGDIEEGWEWFAFTFNMQEPFELTATEINEMLNASDSIVKQAYNRMLMDLPTQKWTKSTRNEVDYIIAGCQLSPDYKILDVGCGTGRHTIEFSKRGFHITGIDYAGSLISVAKGKAKEENAKCDFLCGDITGSRLPFGNSEFDTVLCLYDVVGSYVDDSKNRQILENISSLLKAGGYAVISVMNLHLTEAHAKHTISLEESSKMLLELQASDTMEQTGDIFNPDYYLLDTRTKIVYRKELFSYDDSSSHCLPIELIVRDRRYYMEEITTMCNDAGLEIIQKRFVNAGWQKDYEATGEKAKEILLICRKAETIR
jgi:2-polyprenyl-3-methyl-5-hydroxy-6-metoxy-1,4-benzoquinol methylase